jgi:hypothetical protein
MRFIFFVFSLAITCFFKAYAQDSLPRPQNKPAVNRVEPATVNPFSPDSVVKASSQTLMHDSIAGSYLIPDSSKIKNRAFDSVLKTAAGDQFFRYPGPLKRSALGKTGKIRVPRDRWVLAVVAALFAYTALLNFFFGRDLKSIFESFYHKRPLSQTDKETGLVNLGAFGGLGLLFCLTLGLFLYQVTSYYNIGYSLSGFDLFISFASIIGVLIVLKFILLKFIGFIFNIGTVIGGYVAVLNLTYFSLAFVFLAVNLCFSLLARQFIPQLLTVCLIATALILAWQYLRNSLNIISGLRFHKFYLFIYLCALEICPVLVLIKALNR